MGLVKELYIKQLEQRAQMLVDAGMSEEEAYDIAGDQAYHDLGDHMADLANKAKDRAKDEGKAS